MWEVLKTAKAVSRKSLQVLIEDEALEQFCRDWMQERAGVPAWDVQCHSFDNSEDTVFYLLVLDSLNFCFWPPSGHAKWEIEYKSKRYSGYYALAAAVKRAIESGVPINRADYLAELSFDQLLQLLGGRGELQLLKPRLRVLQELGQVLLKDYGGKAHKLVEDAGGSAIAFVRLVSEKLSSFRDVAAYQGMEVFFYKRAQILASDLYGAFKGKGFGAFSDIGDLTAFADYKLPQVLRHVGILRYGESLARRVDQQIYVEAGSPEEVEIRANTILAVELIRQELDKAGRRLRAFEIDWMLWNLGQQDKFRAKPYHRTLTIFY